MRTGAWISEATSAPARASGEEVGSTFPIASSSGNPSIAPAPRKKVRRGSKPLFWFISKSFFRIKAVLKRIAGGDLHDQDRGAIVIFLQGFHGFFDHTIVELIQFAAIGEADHFFHQVLDDVILAAQQDGFQTGR